MNRSIILLIRHGFSLANNVSWNQQRGLQEILGELAYDENVPLEQYGIKQAKETGNFLNQLMSNKKVLFIASPYRRATETLFHILEELSDSIKFEVFYDKTLREIDAGIHFAKTENEIQEQFPEEYYQYFSIVQNLSANKQKSFIPYYNGEGQQDVRRRVRSFTSKLKSLAQAREDSELKYDYICIISHKFINRWIYYWLNDKQSLENNNIQNGEIILANGPDAGKSLFMPSTFVPKGYYADLEKYKTELIRMECQEMLSKFQSKYEKWKSLFETDTFKVSKEGFDLYIPNTNTDEYGCFLVDSIYGHDSIAYDSKSTHTYYVLDGDGEFQINNKTIYCKQGDVIVIQPNDIFYYSGAMKLIEEIVPNFDEKNFHIIETISYKEKKSKK